MRSELGTPVQCAEHREVEQAAGLQFEAGAGPDAAPAGFADVLRRLDQLLIAGPHLVGMGGGWR